MVLYDRKSRLHLYVAFALHAEIDDQFHFDLVIIQHCDPVSKKSKRFTLSKEKAFKKYNDPALLNKPHNALCELIIQVARFRKKVVHRLQIIAPPS